MKLLVDMNLSPRWVDLLHQEGVPAVHWANVGAHRASDAEIMAYAEAKDYIVLTHDLDFSAILAATGAASRVLSKYAVTMSALTLSVRR